MCAWVAALLAWSRQAYGTWMGTWAWRVAMTTIYGWPVASCVSSDWWETGPISEFPDSMGWSKVTAGHAARLVLGGHSPRSPGEGNGNPLKYSCLENPMDTGAWWAIVHRVAKNRKRLSDYTTTKRDGGTSEQQFGLRLSYCSSQCYWTRESYDSSAVLWHPQKQSSSPKRAL